MYFPSLVHLSCWHPGGIALTMRALELAQNMHILPQEGRFLDVGCGKGQSVALLRAQGFEAYGIDKDIAYLNATEYLCATATALPFCTQSFHAIMCECVLSLLPIRTQALQEFWRIGAHTPMPTLLLLSDIYSKKNSHNQDDTFFTQQKLKAELHATGWKLHYFEDHSSSLKAYAAQLAWHNVCLQNLTQKDIGYGLWIARKEHI